MKRAMYPVDQVQAMILRGEQLVVSGDEELLRALPAGDWIGGTTPYFMAEEGGICTAERLFVTPLDEDMSIDAIRVYDENSLARIFADVPNNGFGLVIIPAFTPCHAAFAMRAPTFPEFAVNPVIGWIAGVDLDKLGEQSPKVVDGRTRQIISDGAVVMHVRLPANKAAEIDILNIFQPGEGDTITFPKDGCIVDTAFVNGREVNFAEYVAAQKFDTRLPLVVDSAGAMINISFQSVDVENGQVKLYAPVFRGYEYRHARAVDDYVSQFTHQMPREEVDKIFFSCNCILNYLYSDLEGKRTGSFMGPVTFGEIAYQLLNQTLVYLKIHQVG